MEGKTRASLPFVGMITVVLVQASNMVVLKMAMSDGINKYTMTFYCNALSTLVLLPCPFIISRRSGSGPPLTFSVLRKIFLLALIGLAGQMCGYVGVDYSSPILGTAMMKPHPSFHFRSRHYIKSNWILGGLLFAAEAFSNSLWYIGQAFILKDYPVVLNIMFYSMFFLTILSGLSSFIIVREPQSWILKINVGLITILYSGLVSGVFKVTLSTWCLKKTGPVYVSMFRPLGIVFAVGLGFIFLGEMLYLGSLIGAIVIVMGFYGVLWGKFKEEEKTIEGSEVEGSLASSSQKIPLLQSKA